METQTGRRTDTHIDPCQLRFLQVCKREGGGRQRRFGSARISTTGYRHVVSDGGKGEGRGKRPGVEGRSFMFIYILAYYVRHYR